MAWRDVRLSGKLLVGFGVVIALLVVVGVWAVVGINQIVSNAQQVIGGNEFRGEISQREVDHLNWTIGLNALLTDENVHELTVETDPTQCAFGRWYYSDARLQAEAEIPALAPLFSQIEEPHNRLHASAVAIGERYIRVDASLGSFLREVKTEHVDWVHQLGQVFVDPQQDRLVGVELDPRESDLGRFLYSPETAQLRASDPAFDAAITPIYGPYEQLFESASFLDENLAAGRKEAMRAYFLQTTESLADQTLAAIDRLITWHDAKMATLAEMNTIYSSSTTPALRDVQNLLQQIVRVSEEHVMTDALMLSAAQQTRFGVLVIVVVAAIAGVILALVIAMGIVRPLVKGVSFSNEIALGDLTVQLDIAQKDEIGQLADSMREMQSALQSKARVVESFAQGDFTVEVQKSSEGDGLGESLIVMKESLNDILNQVRVAVEQVASGSSQVSSASQDLSHGATESASSLEEISASINQINAQSKENMNSASEASGLSKQAAADAAAGQERMTELRGAMESMSEAAGEIGRVVKVIDDIAFQINLLALNANVEAARAGKYGKGFGVVAEEVRNLAVRSAEAVKETTAIVEQSVQSINSGSQMTVATAEQLDAIAAGARRVADFLEEISESSREQSIAIDQISDGLAQVDQVTQANTASAEESAAASEELSSQSEQLRVSVSKFHLVEESADGKIVAQLRPPIEDAVRVQLARHPRNGHTSNGSSRRTEERPEDVILLDDDAFDRF